jgi:hypothetical protein
MICFLPLIQRGWDWFYVGLVVLALIFAFRISGATFSKYPGIK